jgi:hypothetical protein
VKAAGVDGARTVLGAVAGAVVEVTADRGTVFVDRPLELD